MGHLDQFAKMIFSEETRFQTQAAFEWNASPEVSLSEVRLDGVLIAQSPATPESLPAPWALAQAAQETVVEIKMQGDHVNSIAFERGLLRRQAWQVTRIEDKKQPLNGQSALWFVSGSLPEWFAQSTCFEAKQLAPGAYSLQPFAQQVLWVAANELPLQVELLPFLVARTGQKLVDLALWAAKNLSVSWTTRLLENTFSPVHR